LLLTIGNDKNLVPAFTVVGSLKLSSHTVDDFIGNLAEAETLSLLTLGDRTGYYITNRNEIRLGGIDTTSDFRKGRLSLLGVEVCCVINYGVIFVECGDCSVVHGVEDCSRIGLVFLISPQLFAELIGRKPYILIMMSG
jgi:hypothetical protein